MPVYVVRSGDTLSGIADTFGSSVQAISASNGISNPDLIFPGMILCVPGSPDLPVPPTTVNVVQPGDTLNGVAEIYGVSVEDIVEFNGIQNPNLIFVDQILCVPLIGPEGFNTIYMVQPEDTLVSIAADFGTSVGDILERNPVIEDPDLIFPGQRLVIRVRGG